MLAKTSDRLIAAIAARYPEATHFVSRRPHACTILCIEVDFCRLIYLDEATPDQIDDVYSQAIAAGHTSAGGGLLVDFTHFTGSLDWNFAKRRKTVAPGMHPQPPKVAYVMPGDLGVKTARAITMWLSHYDCRIFSNIVEAEAWLQKRS